jgi:hypothetical protein
LLQHRQIVEHTPLLGNAAISDPEDRNLLSIGRPVSAWSRSALDSFEG